MYFLEKKPLTIDEEFILKQKSELKMLMKKCLKDKSLK
jgi:hypothetical protein